MTEQREELLSASSRLPIRAIWVRWRRCSPKTWCCTVTAVVRCPPWHGRPRSQPRRAHAAGLGAPRLAGQWSGGGIRSR
jgi:hypothetical protein